MHRSWHLFSGGSVVGDRIGIYTQRRPAVIRIHLGTYYACGVAVGVERVVIGVQSIVARLIIRPEGFQIKLVAPVAHEIGHRKDFAVGAAAAQAVEKFGPVEQPVQCKFRSLRLPPVFEIFIAIGRVFGPHNSPACMPTMLPSYQMRMADVGLFLSVTDTRLLFSL